MGLAFDRQAFLDILNEGKGAIGGNMLPPPDGAWGMPREVLQTLPGYGPDVEKNRAEARKTMEKLGYGPDKRLAINNRLQAVLRHVLVEHDQVVEHLHYRQFGVGKLLKHREARDTLGVIHPQRAAGLLGECRGGNCERGQESGDRPEATNVRLHVPPLPACRALSRALTRRLARDGCAERAICRARRPLTPSREHTDLWWSADLNR